MRRTFAPLDDALIERVYQPLTDRLAEKVGMRGRRAACLLLDAAGIAWILSQAQAPAEAAHGWDAVTMAWRGGALLIGLAALSSLRTLFRRAPNGMGNPLRASMQPHRGIALMLFAARMVDLGDFGFSEFADVAMLLCAVSALYLGACAERPPVRRRSEDVAPAAMRAR
jgi:hypothetical protein